MTHTPTQNKVKHYRTHCRHCDRQVYRPIPVTNNVRGKIHVRCKDCGSIYEAHVRGDTS